MLLESGGGVIWSSGPLDGSHMFFKIFFYLLVCLDSTHQEAVCSVLSIRPIVTHLGIRLPAAFTGPLDRISLSLTYTLFHSGPFHPIIPTSIQRSACHFSQAQVCLSLESLSHKLVLAVILFLPHLALPGLFFFLCPWRIHQLLQSMVVRVSIVQGT